MAEPAVDRADLRVDGFDPGLARRVRQTVACTDCDQLPKVPRAGEVLEYDSARVQVMHNGVLVEEGGYFGDWMAEIIRVLRGHHEPQEERVFAAMIAAIVADYVAEQDDVPVMIEFGSFWAYYSLWFCHDLPTGRAFGIEPDPAYLEVGRRNVGFNALDGRVFLAPGAVGADPGSLLAFVAESDGVERSVVQYDLASLMQEHALDHVDLVLVDIQGWETVLLERALPLLRAERVRFLLVSTHHHSISGDALTHQRVRDLLVNAGATVLAEHTVGESASGDGLVAVSFDERDRHLTVEVSHRRSQDSLFGEPEHELAAAFAAAVTNREALMATQHELAEIRVQLDTARMRVKRLRRRVNELTRPTSVSDRGRNPLTSVRRRLTARRSRRA